jgi:hypothetical protein
LNRSRAGERFDEADIVAYGLHGGNRGEKFGAIGGNLTTTQEPSGWAIGWTAFAAIMMIMMGFFHGLAGLVAVLEDELYAVTPEYVLQLDVTTWGWVHLVLGAIVLIAGIFLFTGSVFARTIGVIVAAVSAIANFAWLPYYPIWALVIITSAAFVIWALTAHGRDITAR